MQNIRKIECKKKLIKLKKVRALSRQRPFFAGGGFWGSSCGEFSAACPGLVVRQSLPLEKLTSGIFCSGVLWAVRSNYALTWYQRAASLRAQKMPTATTYLENNAGLRGGYLPGCCGGGSQGAAAVWALSGCWVLACALVVGWKSRNTTATLRPQPAGRVAPWALRGMYYTS